MPTPQDGLAAAHRAQSSYRGDRWHPLLNARETVTGTEWQLGIEAGSEWYPRVVVLLLTISGELGYRVVTWAPTSAERRLVGYRTSLRAACELGWREYLRTAGGGNHAGAPNGHS